MVVSSNKRYWCNGMWELNVDEPMVNFVKHGELRSKGPNVELIPAQGVD